jgi:hypothetical protein
MARGDFHMGRGVHDSDRLQHSENRPPTSKKHSKMHLVEPFLTLCVRVEVFPQLPVLRVETAPITTCNLRSGLINRHVGRIPRIPPGPFAPPELSG